MVNSAKYSLQKEYYQINKRSEMDVRQERVNPRVYGTLGPNSLFKH